MVNCHGRASEAVTARIGGGWKKGVKWCVICEAGFIFEATGEDLSVLC